MDLRKKSFKRNETEKLWPTVKRLFHQNSFLKNNDRNNNQNFTDTFIIAKSVQPLTSEFFFLN